MMAQFSEKYPDHGLLLVVDELLDYLKSRKERDLILDLGFLREIGEVCKLIRFRFIAGLQESLFDNPKFQFVADEPDAGQGQVRASSDRPSGRSLCRLGAVAEQDRRAEGQDPGTSSEVHATLRLHGRAARRVRSAFPRPSRRYLEVFEAISIAEKREVLKTLSSEIRRLLNKDVPSRINRA